MAAPKQAIVALLEERWTESITDRATDVPTPTIVEEKSVSRSDLKTDDYARVVDGGGRSFEPMGFGWTHERIDADVTIELRTADRRQGGGATRPGNERLFGDRDSTAEPDRYIGLVGETKRVLDSARKGFAEFDLVIHSDERDESDLEGTNYYRADIDVALVQHAHQIDAST